MRIPPQANRQARHFSPFADPDLVGLWVADDATDNGTALTLPNRKSGGVSATASGVGRPTIAANAIEAFHAGILTTGSTVPLKAAASLAGKSAVTIYHVTKAAGAGPTTYHWWYGSFSTHYAYSTYGSGVYRIATHLPASGNQASLGDTHSGGQMAGARVACHRISIGGGHTPNDCYMPLLDGDTLATVVANAGSSTGTFAAGDMVFGSAYNGSSPIQGHVAAFAIVARAHTDAEVAIWTRYLQTLYGTQGHIDFLWSGDSLTLGEPSMLGGFRKRIMTLWEARAETDRWYRNVGPYNPYQQFDQDWCMAVGGRLIAQMTADLPNFLGPTKPCKPAIIPLMLGTNDITTGNASRQAHYDTLLDTYASLAPQAKIIVQRPLVRSDGFSAASETFGDLIRDVIVPAAQGRGVRCEYDDTAWTASQTATYVNAIHPDAAGFNHIGDALEPQTRVWAGKAP